MPQPRKYPDNSARQAAYRRRQASARQAERTQKGLPALPTLSSVPGTARWRAAIAHAAALLTTVKDEMLAYFDDRSETWQDSERGAAHQERIDALEEVLAALDEHMS
jgi:hypothetical protein